MSTRDVPLAPDPSPAGARAQAGTSGVRRREGLQLLAALVGSPLAWVVHFNGIYLIVAAWCAERWAGLGVAVAVLTAACAAAAIASGVLAFRLWRRGQSALLSDAEPGGPEPWDARMGERGARGVFLAVIAVFMAAIFTWLILLEGLPPLFAPHCRAGTGP